MATKVVTARNMPIGQAVQAVPYLTSDVERREGRAPVPAASASGILDSSHQVTIEAEPGQYVLFAVTNAVHKLIVKAKKGKFKLKVNVGGETKETAGIKFNATALEVKEAIQALSNVGAGNVEVTGGPGSESGAAPYLIEFRGKHSGKAVATVEAVTTELEESPKEVTPSSSVTGSRAPVDAAKPVLFTID